MSRCYVGNLPADPSEIELKHFFEEAGTVLDVQVKRTISNDWFAFVHFEQPDGATEAVRRFDGGDFRGSRLRVELPFSSGSRKRLPPRRHSSGRVAVRVFNVPPSGSWQDLKDHFREAGDCIFADVFGDGSGIVEYSNFEDAQMALQMFNNSSFRSHQGECSRIHLELAPPPRARSRPYYDDDGYGPTRRGSGPPRYDRRRRFERRRSPYPNDERYTTQDSRSTDAYSSRASYAKPAASSDRTAASLLDR